MRSSSKYNRLYYMIHELNGDFKCEYVEYYTLFSSTLRPLESLNPVGKLIRTLTRDNCSIHDLNKEHVCMKREVLEVD